MPADELAPTACRESDFDHPWAKGLARLRLGRPISSRNQDTEQGRESRNRDRFRRFHVSANPRRERWTFEVQSLSQRFLAGLSAADIERAHRQHKIAGLLGMEGGHAIEDSPRLLRDYYRLGVRYLTLTHTNTNGWADSSGDIKKPDVQHRNGLTPLGKDIVHEMNRLSIMVDISRRRAQGCPGSCYAGRRCRAY